jgi:hypothetical protein
MIISIINFNNIIHKKESVMFIRKMNGLILVSVVIVLIFSSNAYADGNTFPANGNVGIGTTAPKSKLVVTLDGVKNQFTLINSHYESGGWARGGDLQYIDSKGFPHVGLSYGIYGSGETYHGTYFSTKIDEIDPWRDAQLYLKSNGNVGINTHNPWGDFDIHASNNQGLIFHLNKRFNGDAIPVTENNTVSIQSSGVIAGNIAFATGNVEAVRINPEGNVGIGTIHPQSRLAVNGTITAKEVKVTASGWSDFVFEDNYKLLPIDQLKEFLKINKRLPDIPSSKELAEKDIAVSEMLAKQMQTIEELTLYVIELKNKNEQLEKRLNTIEQGH